MKLLWSSETVKKVFVRISYANINLIKTIRNNQNNYNSIYCKVNHLAAKLFAVNLPYITIHHNIKIYFMVLVYNFFVYKLTWSNSI